VRPLPWDDGGVAVTTTEQPTTGPAGQLVGQVLTRPQRRERTDELLRRLRDCASADERHELTDELVMANLGVADAVVSPYRSRGIPTEDLRQVAYMALVKAAHNFDSTRGYDFLSYTVPTIRGEIRRHFRDHGWMVRPPRRIQDLQRRVSTASAELASDTGTEPTPVQIAAHLGEAESDVREAMGGEGCFTPASLDHPVGDGSTASLGDLLPDEERGSTAAEARVMLAPVVQRLAPRDRRILRLRFFEGLTQQEIAEDIGVTQMQVSRLLSRIYADLRRQLGRLPPGSLAS
jgi:RNA polymerase sigma-B factor